MQLHPTNLSLERKLPLVLAGLLAAMLATSLAVTYRVLTVSGDAARMRLSGAAQAVAETAQHSVEDRARQLQAAAAHPAIQAVLTAGPAASVAQREAARQALHELQAPGSVLLSVELWDTSGARVVHDGAGSTAATRPPLTRDRVVHSPMYEADGNVFAWTVVPVQGAGGGVLGSLAAQLRLGGPAAGAQTVRDLTGEDVTMYTRNVDGGVWMKHPGTPAAAPSSVRELRGGLRHVREDGGKMTAVEARIAGTPWVVTLEAPERLVLARAKGTVRLLALVSLALLVIGTVLLWLFSRRFTQPLLSVTRAAEAIAAGDYGRRVEVGGGDELGRLAASFNQMAGEIETSRRELIRRVYEAQEARLEAERLRAVADHARDLAERASRARGDFLAVMSHELRTPLNAIGGYTQLLELGIHGPINEAQVGALRRIARNQEHLLTLINDVLNFAKLDVGKVQYTLRDIPVTDVFTALEPLIGPLMRTHELAFSEVAPDPTVTVRADADKLQQVLLNLLANAVKFTPAGGSITLAASAVDSVVQIHVRDTGVGIAPERLEAIFDPFVQGDRALNRPVEGVGLGLAISRELARGMSGELVVQSTLGAGSVFTVMLPRGAPALRIAHAG